MENTRRILSDDGLCGETGTKITSATAIRSGAATAVLSKKICIACNGEKSAEALSYAAASGAAEKGADVFLLGALPEPALDLAMKLTGAKNGIFISSGPFTKIKFLSERGLPLSSKEEKALEKSLCEEDTARYGEYGRIERLSGIGEIYAERIKETLGKITRSVRIYSPQKEVMDIAERIFPKCRGDGDIVFNISSDCRKVSAFTIETGHIFYEKLLTLGCVYEFKEGRDISLPYSAPRVAEKIAEKYGASVSRYFERTSDFSDEKGRKDALYCRFARDAFSLVAIILRYLEDRKITLAEALSELPDFTATTRFVPTDNAEKVFNGLCKEKAGENEGTAEEEDGRRVIIRPIRSGKGVVLIAESFESETASELCDFYEKKIRSF